MHHQQCLFLPLIAIANMANWLARRDVLGTGGLYREKDHHSQREAGQKEPLPQLPLATLWILLLLLWPPSLRPLRLMLWALSAVPNAGIATSMVSIYANFEFLTGQKLHNPF
jgi:hypothetical protein